MRQLSERETEILYVAVDRGTFLFQVKMALNWMLGKSNELPDFLSMETCFKNWGWMA